MSKKNIEDTSKTSDNKPDRNEKGQLLPGNTANPNGRPPNKLSLTALLINELSEDDGAKAKKLIKKTISQATKGHSGLVKEILDRVDGRVALPVEHTGRVVIGRYTIGKGYVDDDPQADDDPQGTGAGNEVL